MAAIRRWWEELGRANYGRAKRVLVTADSGGSNSSRSRLWKVELQKWADETGLIVEVCHYPPGTSQWNKIEHRVFCHITRNRRGSRWRRWRSWSDRIGATTTVPGLEVHAWLDEGTYEKGRKVSDEELAVAPQGTVVMPWPPEVASVVALASSAAPRAAAGSAD